MNHNRGDVYLVLYPFDDDEREKIRPAIIFHTKDSRSIVIKVTSHEEREDDDKDIEIAHWEKAGLDEPSVARCGKFVPLHHDKIQKYLGTLHDEDQLRVLEKFYS